MHFFSSNYYFKYFIDENNKNRTNQQVLLIKAHIIFNGVKIYVVFLDTLDTFLDTMQRKALSPD